MKFQASRLCLGGVLPDPRISRMAPGHARRGRAKSDLSPFTLPWVPACAGMTGECAGMTGGARERG